MQLRLSIADGHRVRTVSVRAPRGLTWSQVPPELGAPTAPDLVVEYAGRTVPLRADTVLGEPPLVHGATIRPGRRERDPSTTTAPVLLAVTGGPDAGGAYALRPGGRLTLGRSRWCDVVVDDPGLSRHHLTLATTRHGIVVEDSGSTNGTRLAGEPLDGATVWPPGRPVHAGASTFHLLPASATLSRAHPNGEGRLVVRPRGQSPPPLAPAELALPDKSSPTAPVAPAALGWLLPLVVSVLLAVVLSMPALLLFGLMAPAMSLGGHLGERRRYRRECVAAEEAHRRGTAAVHGAVREAVARELHRREERAPDLARLLQSVQQSGPLLWSRSTATPVCRLGAGEQATFVTLDGAPVAASGVPIEIDLSNGLSLLGPPQEIRAAARGVLIQLGVLHAPGDLRIEIAGRDGQRAGSAHRAAHPAWDWLAWLPHASASPGAHTIVRLTDLTLRGARESRGAHPSGQVTTAGGPGGPRLLPAGSPEAPPEPRVIPITLCAHESQALDGTTVVSVHHSVLTVRGHSDTVTGAPDLLSAPRAHRAARLLAPLTDGSGEDETGSVPTGVDLATVSPVPIAAVEVAEQWRREPRSTRFVLGRDGSGPVALDLAGDGPHALVAGTTGSGKSELLRTLVTSLSLVNRPDELVLVLVDYKGGSAFAEAEALPHVVGMITDLDPHLADRALTSLTAELKRRERILAAARVPDLPAYQDLPPDEPLPRLVIVIDEFRALAEELPDFLDGLVRIAALGRSLGVHLVLATQRPGGVVSADVRANVNLRIALRVRDGSDSYDVLDSPAAADLPERVPGRALIRTGASAPRTVQVASSSTPTTTGEAVPAEPISVLPVPDVWSDDVHPSAGTASAPADGGTSTLARVIAATTEAARLTGATPPPSPWLQALPVHIGLSDLDGGAAGPLTVPLMLTDLPAEQRQPVHHWRPLTDGHLGIAGAARSGRSTVVRTVLAGLLAQPPGEVHLYAFDLAGSLGPIAEAPHVGAVLTASDVARGCRVIAHLADLVGSRQRALAAEGFTSLSEQRRRSDEPWPLVVLVIDGWPRFAELFGETDRGRPLEQVLQLLREGLAVGVVAVLTGDRSVFGGRIAPLVPEMWSLRLTDPSDLLMAGLTRSQVPESMPPGRVIRLRDGVVGQVAVVGPGADGAEQVAALAELVARGSSGLPAAGRTARPVVFRPLPRTVHLDQLLPCATDSLLIGVGGDAADPLRIPVPPMSAGVLGIVGPPRSGRSCALHTLAASAAGHRWTVIPVGPGHLRDGTALQEDLQRAGTVGTLLTVDGLAQIAGTAAEDVLLSWLDAPSDAQPAPRLVAVTGDAEDFTSFRGLGARTARERTGIVLQPAGPTDGSPLGVTVPTGGEALPGRGVLVLRGECTAVQVALPEVSRR